MSKSKVKVNEAVEQFRENTRKEALEIFEVHIPKKLAHLQTLYKSHILDTPVTQFGFGKAEDKDDAGEEGGDRKRRRVEKEAEAGSKARVEDGVYLGEVPCNQEIMKVTEIIRTEFEDASCTLHKLKLWIQLSIPRIEDGNNFGVEVQEETLHEVSAYEKKCHNILDMLRHYFSSRAHLVAKSLRYPGVEDYSRSVVETDKNAYFLLSSEFWELQKVYSVVYDMISKNLEKILNPRGQEDTSLRGLY